MSSNDDGSVSSTVSDEGYAEFLRFLQSPSVSKANTKQQHEEDVNDESQGSLPESLPDGPKVVIGSMEDSMAATQENVDSSDKSSFYIGPGELGFDPSGSVHESDISETESDDESVTDKTEGSSDAELVYAQAASVAEMQLLQASKKEDEASVSSDEGYNEFLRFLMTPTVAVSVSDDGSVTLSVSLQDKEVGSVTLSVKDETSVKSYDAGYEEFLMFLQSPGPAKKSVSGAEMVDDVHSSKEEDEMRSLEEKSWEEGAVAKADVADGKKTAMPKLKHAVVDDASSPPSSEFENNAEVSAIKSAYAISATAPESDPPETAEVELMDESSISPSSEPTAKEEVSVVMKAAAAEGISTVLSSDTKSRDCVEVEKPELSEAAVESSKVEEVIEKSSSPEPVQDIETEKNAADEPMQEPDSATKSIYAQPEDLHKEPVVAAAVGSAAVAGAVAATVRRSESPKPSNSIAAAKNEEIDNKGPVLAAAAAVGSAVAFGGKDTSKAKTEDDDANKDVTAATIGVAATPEHKVTTGDGDEVGARSVSQERVGYSANKLANAAAIRVVVRSPSPDEIDADEPILGAASAAVNNSNMLSPISKIYFSDVDLGDDLAISNIYFADADLQEEDVVKANPTDRSGNNDNHVMQSPITSEGTFSDLLEEESVQSLGEGLMEELLQPDVDQKSLEAKDPSPLAIVGKVSINEEFMKSLSSAGSFDEFFDCLSQASRQSSIVENVPKEGFLNVSVHSGSAIISLEDFYECVSVMSLKSNVSESELSKLSRDHSSEYIIRTFLLSLVFHLCQFKLESGVAEICIWGHLYTRFMRSAHVH